MAGFTYRMQNILDIKISLEEQAKMQYAAANRRLQEEEEKLIALRERKENYELQAKLLLCGNLNVQEIMDTNQAILKMDEYISAQQMQVHMAQLNLDKARKHLTEAMQERKMHERLREKAFEQYVEDEKHKEIKEIDELTSYTYGLKTMTGEE